VLKTVCTFKHNLYVRKKFANVKQFQALSFFQLKNAFNATVPGVELPIRGHFRVQDNFSTASDAFQDYKLKKHHRV
jgi:hypothetical protein